MAEFIELPASCYYVWLSQLKFQPSPKNNFFFIFHHRVPSHPDQSRWYSGNVPKREPNYPWTRNRSPDGENSAIPGDRVYNALLTAKLYWIQDTKQRHLYCTSLKDTHNNGSNVAISGGHQSILGGPLRSCFGLLVTPALSFKNQEGCF